jgi:DnaJ like chaperone protein
MKWVLTILALAYLFNPFDLLPDIVVGAGWLDDLVVMGLLGYYLYRAGYRGFPFGSESKREQNPKGSPPNGADGGAADDPRQILGVGPDADQTEIRQAYRRLAAQYHPDKVAHLGVDLRHLAEQKFKSIQAAYELLKRS